MKNLTKAQLAVLMEAGAEVEVLKKAPPKPVDAPQPDSLAKLLSGTTAAQDRQALVLAEITAMLGHSQGKLAEQLAAITARAAMNGSTAFRFTINRDSRGLIESVDAHPIEITTH